MADINFSEVWIPGATVSLICRRKSDNYYWTGAAWQVGVDSVAMSEEAGLSTDYSRYTSDTDPDVACFWFMLADRGGGETDLIASGEYTPAAYFKDAVVEALTVDTYAEPVAVPSATSSLMDKINWLFILARNKITQSSITQVVRNDADDANVGEAPVQDDGNTTTRGEWS